MEGTPIDREKLLSLSYLSKGRTRDKVREYLESNAEVAQQIESKLRDKLGFNKGE